jgi:hypothetical protein
MLNPDLTLDFGIDVLIDLGASVSKSFQSIINISRLLVGWFQFALDG